MHKFLYLTEIEWAKAWIEGGIIPISLASSYLSKDRNGIYTPDENLIHDSPVDLKSLSPFIHIADGAQIKGLTLKNNRINGALLPDVINAQYYNEDGLILSFCNEFHTDIALKMNKKCCVKIHDIEKLGRNIGKQLKKPVKMGSCEYTKNHARNHFLKSIDDSWQNEYRMFWHGMTNVSVKIEPCVAELIWSKKHNK